MPRQARLDAPRVLHHIIARGIEGTKIFRTKGDRLDFVERLETLGEAKALVIYAWALMPNHFHLLVRTGKEPLPTSMRKLLTGYVVNFNRRHKRSGHLFQNRYKSIICETDPYLLELTRYIHLNPLRAGLMSNLEELGSFPWSGHSAILGRVKRPWQDTDTVLACFSPKRGKAIARYESFVRKGVSMGRRPELVGGGLIRSTGGWSQVLSYRRQGVRSASDARILGSSGFVERLLKEIEEREKKTLRLKRKIKGLSSLAKEIAQSEGITIKALRSGARSRGISRARRLFSHMAVSRMGYSGAQVARFLGVTTSAVIRAAKAPETLNP